MLSVKESAQTLWEENNNGKALPARTTNPFETPKDGLANEPGRLRKLELQGVSPDAFHALLDYMYSGKLHLTCQNIGKLYVTASILKIARVKKKCARILTKSPYDPKHAVYVYVTARKYGLTSVCKRALKLLHHRLEETVTCKPFLDLDVNQVCEVLSGNTVGARGEMVMFLAALHWLNHNYLENEPYVLKVMQCVRFGTMSIEELLCCLHPPVLPGIMEVHEVRAHILAALCYKVAAMYNQQHLFPVPQLKARYFKLDGPITMWDLNMFSTIKNPPPAAPASVFPTYLNDASANILRKAPLLTLQFPGQRDPVFHSDPLADYLLRNQAEIPLSPWSGDPYEALDACASGTHARDPRSPVLLVVGGFDPDAPGNTTVGTKILRYHVEKNVWEKLESFPMPRHHHSAVLHRDKLYITGGYDNYQTARSKLEPTSVCFSYDLTKKLWQPLPNMARCRAYHAAACFDGTLFVVGGRSSNGEILSSMEALSLEERRQWQEMPCRLCRPRMAAGSAQMGGRLWIAGGLTDSRAGLVVISDVDCFDPCNCEFYFHVSFLPTPRCFFSLVAVDDKLFALGGCSVKDNELESLGDVWSCLDHCWERRGTFDQGYHDVGTVAYGDSVYMVGGLSSDTKSGIRAVSCYRTTHNAFTPSLAPLPRALCGAAVVVLPPMEIEVASPTGLDGKRWTANTRVNGADSDVDSERSANTGSTREVDSMRVNPGTGSGRSSSTGTPPPYRGQLGPPPNQGNPWHTWHRSSTDRPSSTDPAVAAAAVVVPAERVQQSQQPPPRCAHSEYRRPETNKPDFYYRPPLTSRSTLQQEPSTPFDALSTQALFGLLCEGTGFIGSYPDSEEARAQVPGFHDCTERCYLEQQVFPLLLAGKAPPLQKPNLCSRDSSSASKIKTAENTGQQGPAGPGLSDSGAVRPPAGAAAMKTDERRDTAEARRDKPKRGPSRLPDAPAGYLIIFAVRCAPVNRGPFLATSVNPRACGANIF
ncbi:hypothetical protein HPB50_026278 [Hyalomma asiaticum]|uniref:Uncharacterized protein n=1 Tax=Hyalomma asiaticum TaxID=266040 RepID=A0ACB7SQ13_HYAAI|nr:hypothetical protein HPB50_026278 [Hyalomma asiaticum]